MFDIAQAAIGMDGSGPTEFIPAGYNGSTYAAMKYQNGIVMTEQPFLEGNDGAQGIKFIGDKGWIEVARGYLACSDKSKVPAELAGQRPLTMEEMKKRWEEMKNRQKNKEINLKVVWLAATKPALRICRILLTVYVPVRTQLHRLKLDAVPILFAV